MYETGTILKLKDPKSKPKKPFPYDRVKVLGASPVRYSTRGAGSNRGNWQGENAQGVIIQPLTEFASNLDEPYGRLQRLYDVESLPPAVEVPANPMVRRFNADSAEAGPTPEEVFAAAAGRLPEEAPPPPRREPDPVEALDSAPAPQDASPLDEVDGD